MWVPADVEAIERAARAGDLTETPSFDAKADLPQPKKNASLAVDVAAMTTDGGVLLYGVGEDQNKQPTVPQPIQLTGAADRVGQIVATSIAEAPYVDVRDYPCSDDPSRGYLLVIVPQSARAPHQVTVGGDLRYYGRGAKGNRILTEGEVGRLYARRQVWEVDRDRLLADCIADAPLPPHGHGSFHAFARPVGLDQGMFERAGQAVGGRTVLLRRLHDAVVSMPLVGAFSPGLHEAGRWTRLGADEWRLGTTTEAERRNPAMATRLAEARVNRDGRGQAFNARASDTLNGSPVIFEVIIAGTAAGFLALLHEFYEAAGYHGHVDVGVAVTGVEGATSYARLGSGITYDRDGYFRHRRIAAAQLADAPGVAHDLLRDFYDATTGIEDFNPFEGK